MLDNHLGKLRQQPIYEYYDQVVGDILSQHFSQWVFQQQRFY
jgi:hypothetical protein